MMSVPYYQDRLIVKADIKLTKNSLSIKPKTILSIFHKLIF